METPPSMPSGFATAAVRAEIYRNRDRHDLALVTLDEARPAAAVFTRSLLQGAHIQVAREHLERGGGLVRAVLVNAGNANCSTGQAGIEDNRRVCGALAAALGCPIEQVLFLSTGVIGARLPVPRILDALPALIDALDPSATETFARAIMTTDTWPKVHETVVGDGAGNARVLGAAKGSGMIHPDMATMFGFLFTDAELPVAPRELLRRVTDQSFHRCTVDGDTSPNDTVLLWGSGNAGPVDGAELEVACTDVARELARDIARDGEGATRLVTVRVEGAPSEAEATTVGRVIATSPLTKTAVHGRDPNWGRIVAAAARAGVQFDPERARVWIGDCEVYRHGVPLPENEDAAHRHMLEGPEVVLGIDLGAGSAAAEVWTCDFSADYVRINADYRS